MFDTIRSWFGKGRIKVEWKGVGANGLKSGTAKVPYTGVYDEHALMDHVKNELQYHHNIVVTNMRVVAHIQE